MQLSLPKDRNTQLTIAGTALLLGVAVYAYATLVYSPLKSDIVKARASVKDLSQQLDTAKRRAAELPKLKQEMAALQIEVVEMERELPKTAELPGLLRTFTRRAEMNGLQLSSFAPGKPAPKGEYDEIPYTISALTSFHSLGRFLTDMGKGDRMFATRNLILAPAFNKDDPSKSVNASFMLITFRYHE